ncbi:GTPase IMAP family member 9-like [Cheilinus undulatus]|uniref:GTPase IMAP family member 9-like n=1 Tax=Cheilinus undulatus TaxID=241271 RepID=UPI001BD39006|nr:GTPase IMAP family member 9-like [Cheilinus undulatus]
MAHNRVRNANQMVVISTVEEWLSFKSLLQTCSGDKHVQLTFSSQASNQACDLAVDGHSASLHYAEFKEDMNEADISLALDACFKSCTDGICTFLLLIQGGHYTEKERRMLEILQANFGEEAFKYLVVLSLEDAKVTNTMDDGLLELINMCGGRFCQITSSAARDKLRSLLLMVDRMLTESGITGYTDNMLTEAKKRSTEDLATKVLKQKMKEAEEKEQAFNTMVQQQEERRAKEMEELKAKHTEERKKEAAERKIYEKRTASLEEAMMSHRAMLQLKMNASDDDDTEKISVVFLGISGSGKSSALNLILERAGNQYSISDSIHETTQPTFSCERKQVFAAGRKLILVDTPELWDEDGVEDLELVKDCLSLSLPGPHIFLLVLQVGRFTQGECEMLLHLQRIFGREFAEYTVVLFVSFDGSQHKLQRIDDYVANAHETLQDLVRKCGSRYYELSATKSQNALSFPQVKDLLSGINKLVASHGGRPYPVRRFTEQELQERRRGIEERKEEALEVNYLLKDA